MTIILILFKLISDIFSPSVLSHIKLSDFLFSLCLEKEFMNEFKRNYNRNFHPYCYQSSLNA